MRSGVVNIRECLYCKQPIAELVPGEDNFYDAKYYSDGKMFGAHQVDVNLITCKCCKEVLWVKSCAKIAESTYFYWVEKHRLSYSLPSSCSNAFIPIELNIDELVNLSSSRFAVNDTERLYIRQQICWRFNDRIRVGSPLFIRAHELAVWMENNLALFDLLDPKDSLQLVMMAEVLRYMGDFERSLEVISCLQDPDLRWAKRLYARRCREANTDVFLLGENKASKFIINNEY